MKDWKGNIKSVYTTLGASNHSEGEREENDFYATSVDTVYALHKKLCEKHLAPTNEVIIEPAVGDGAILKTLFSLKKGYNKYLAFDIVDRGFPNTEVTDFLTVKDLSHIRERKCIITNPPYKLASEFVEHSMELLTNGEFCCMLLRIQFLEGKARRKLFEKYPPKYVWVFSERQKCLKNGVDDGTSSAICYAWFFWEKGFSGNPEIEWL